LHDNLNREVEHVPLLLALLLLAWLSPLLRLLLRPLA
jgi:hypothetical protein